MIQKFSNPRGQVTKAIAQLERRARFEGAMGALTTLESAIYAGDDPVHTLVVVSRRVQGELEKDNKP